MPAIMVCLLLALCMQASLFQAAKVVLLAWASCGLAYDSKHVVPCFVCAKVLACAICGVAHGSNHGVSFADSVHAGLFVWEHS